MNSHQRSTNSSSSKGRILKPSRPLPDQVSGTNRSLLTAPSLLTTTTTFLPLLLSATSEIFFRFWKLFLVTLPNFVIRSFCLISADSAGLPSKTTSTLAKGEEGNSFSCFKPSPLEQLSLA